MKQLVAIFLIILCIEESYASCTKNSATGKQKCSAVVENSNSKIQNSSSIETLKQLQLDYAKNCAEEISVKILNLIKKLQATSGNDFQIVRQIKIDHYKTKLLCDRCKSLNQATSNTTKKFEIVRDQSGVIKSCRVVNNTVTPARNSSEPPAPHPVDDSHLFNPPPPPPNPVDDSHLFNPPQQPPPNPVDDSHLFNPPPPPPNPVDDSYLFNPPAPPPVPTP